MKKIISTAFLSSFIITAASAQILTPEERQKEDKAENEKNATVIEAKVAKDKADKALLPAKDAAGKQIGLSKEVEPAIVRPAIKKDEEDEQREKNKNAKVNN